MSLITLLPTGLKLQIQDSCQCVDYSPPPPVYKSVVLVMQHLSEVRNQPAISIPQVFPSANSKNTGSKNSRDGLIVGLTNLFGHLSWAEGFERH